jgi:flagellar L-ring protein precursor FlgH
MTRTCLSLAGLALAALLPAGCGRLDHLGRPPSFSELDETTQHLALYSNPMPLVADAAAPSDAASLWTSSRSSLLGDRRAGSRGDILTVVIEIDDSAQISNATDRSRDGAVGMQMPELFGIPQRLDRRLPEGATMADAVDISGASTFEGQGSVSRQERLALRVAATVVEELPNGVLRIEGSQEVRVNNELRELLVSGFVRPADISRQNEITYDRIAGARIAYGGRGQITAMQEPGWGQQVVDAVVPW